MHSLAAPRVGPQAQRGEEGGSRPRMGRVPQCVSHPPCTPCSRLLRALSVPPWPAGPGCPAPTLLATSSHPHSLPCAAATVTPKRPVHLHSTAVRLAKGGLLHTAECVVAPPSRFPPKSRSLSCPSEPWPRLGVLSTWTVPWMPVPPSTHNLQKGRAASHHHWILGA